MPIKMSKCELYRQGGSERERERRSEFECDLRKPTKRTASEMKKSNQAANAANRMKANRI